MATPLHDRNRAYGIAGTVTVHALVVAVLMLFAPSYAPLPTAPEPGLVAVELTRPPPSPPPPPDAVEQGAAAPPSRGMTEAPSPPPPPAPLARPTPPEPAPDPAADQAAGLGAATGSSAGQGEGSGSGAGGSGSGRGAGTLTPPVRIEGALTHDDYRRARPPRGAAGTVVVGFRVRTDGRADRCTVTRSSGFAGFDEATCRLIEQRFRYRPARDETGRPVEWTIRTDYTWTPR